MIGKESKVDWTYQKVSSQNSCMDRKGNWVEPKKMMESWNQILNHKAQLKEVLQITIWLLKPVRTKNKPKRKIQMKIQVDRTLKEKCNLQLKVKNISLNFRIYDLPFENWKNKIFWRLDLNPNIWKCKKENVHLRSKVWYNELNLLRSHNVKIDLKKPRRNNSKSSLSSE